MRAAQKRDDYNHSEEQLDGYILIFSLSIFFKKTHKLTVDD
jgi:hypothetical protein